VVYISGLQTTARSYKSYVGTQERPMALHTVTSNLFSYQQATIIPSDPGGSMIKLYE
jgi:hypothetical protein